MNEPTGAENVRKALARFSLSSFHSTPEFLAYLIFFLGQAARGAYVETGTDPAAAIRMSKAFNEMGLIASSELASLLTDSGEKRSARDFVRGLQHWAEDGECLEAMVWALAKAEQASGVK